MFDGKVFSASVSGKKRLERNKEGRGAVRETSQGFFFGGGKIGKKEQEKEKRKEREKKLFLFLKKLLHFFIF